MTDTQAPAAPAKTVTVGQHAGAKTRSGLIHTRRGTPPPPGTRYPQYRVIRGTLNNHVAYQVQAQHAPSGAQANFRGMGHAHTFMVGNGKNGTYATEDAAKAAAEAAHRVAVARRDAGVKFVADPGQDTTPVVAAS